ncbi:MAG: hypothetical protein ABDH49_08905 [Candidatus Hydrothermales bacterium]
MRFIEKLYEKEQKRAILCYVIILAFITVILGILFAYLWKVKEIQKSNMNVKEFIEAAKEITSINKTFIEVHKMSIEMQKSVMEILERIEKGQERIAEILLNQTKILERIEGKTK